MTENETVAEPVTEVTYISTEAPKLRMRGETCTFQFENKQLKLTDPAQIAELDNLIKTKPNISSLVRKVDREAALAMAKKDLENKRGNLIKGPSTSAGLTPEVLALHRLHSNAGGEDMKAAVEELKAQGLEITELSDKIPDRLPPDGFIPDTKAGEVGQGPVVVVEPSIKLEDAIEPAKATDPVVDPAVSEGLKARLGKKN